MKPILFKTEMVRAILADRKTVTRRVVRPQPVCHGPNITFDPHNYDFFLSKEKNWLRCRVCGHDPEYSRSESNIAHHWVPPYCPGDILYVRETWQYAYDLDGNEQPIEETGRYLYAADNLQEPFAFWVNPDGTHRDCMPWRPSIHMPREAARIFLRVTELRVERLRDITPDQLRAEGLDLFVTPSECKSMMNRFGAVCDYERKKKDFSDLWDSTIKKADRALYGWEADPWVWVITFKRVSREEALADG